MTLFIIAICVVFSCLLILYFIYSILGKICSKDITLPRKFAGASQPETISNPEPEEPKPDTQSDIKHDLESGIITIVPHTNWTHQFSSVAQTAPPAAPVAVPSGSSRLRWACPPSDTSEGGARRMQVPAEQGRGRLWEGWSERSERSERKPSGAELPPDGTKLTGRKIIYAPLPGIIIEMKVGRGQTVKRGDRIAVLEAMKMENDILAPVDGTITNVFVFKGDSVLEGAKIAEIE